jgi:transposase
LEVDENNVAKKNETDANVSNSLHVSEKTVHRVRQQFANEGLEAALERKPHIKHRPCKIQGDEEARLIALCCSSAPEGRCHWTLSLLAEELIALNILDDVSRSTVGRTLKKTN